MEKELKAILKNSNNKLEKYVIEDILNSGEPKAYLKDLLSYGCVSGMVSGLIYYANTKAFYTKYMDEIHELYEEIKEEL